MINDGTSMCDRYIRTLTLFWRDFDMNTAQRTWILSRYLSSHSYTSKLGTIWIMILMDNDINGK
jgi:hypothetical protein